MCDQAGQLKFCLDMLASIDPAMQIDVNESSVVLHCNGDRYEYIRQRGLLSEDLMECLVYFIEISVIAAKENNR